MAGARLVTDLKQLDRLVGRMRQLAERGRDLRPMMDEIGGALVSSTVHRFETGKGPDGEEWPKSIRAREEGGKTLVDKAHLRDSVTYAAGADSVEIGTNMVYGAIHQMGGDIKAKTAEYLFFKVAGKGALKKKVTIPARPYLGLSSSDVDEIDAIVADYLMEPLQ